MRGDLYINGKDAYDEWRMSLEPGAYLSLVAGYPAKAFVESNIRTSDGRIVRNKGVKDYRSVQIMMHINGKDTRDGIEKYRAFCDEIARGFTLISRWDDNVYILDYKNCTPISNNNGLIKFNVTALDNCSRTGAGVTTVYERPIVKLYYEDISAIGGYARPKLSYSQKVTKTFDYGGTVEYTITSGGKVAYNVGILDDYGVPTGVFNVGVNIGDRRLIVTARATVSLNGKIGSATYDVYQDGLGGSLLVDSELNLISDVNDNLITV